MQVDQKNESILVPIYGVMVPFHILAVKNAVNSQEGDHSYIRINFNFGPAYEPGAKFPQAIFLKELSYRTGDNRHAAKARPPCPPLPALPCPTLPALALVAQAFDDLRFQCCAVRDSLQPLSAQHSLPCFYGRSAPKQCTSSLAPGEA